MTTRLLLQINGAFLMFMGGAAAVADAVGYLVGRGPMAPILFRAPLAISSFEAHLLAALLGSVLWSGAAAAERQRYHRLAAAIHIVLGGSNLLFFERAFGAIDARLFGVLITTCHFAFVLAQSLAALPRPNPSPALTAHKTV